VIRPTDQQAFTEEQIQRVLEAEQIEQMVGLPAWLWLEKRFNELVTQSMSEALRCKTEHPPVAIDAMRRWQITDEIVSTLRAEIQGRIDERDALFSNSNDRMAVILQEQLNGRFSSSGDPAAD